MIWSVDLIAAIALGSFCLIVVCLHLGGFGERGFDRVRRQGGTFFLSGVVMEAGYALLQPVVRWCQRRAVSPALLSWLSLAPALVVAGAGAKGYWGMAAWALLASALLDVLDGAVARATDRTSAGGAVLDSVLDRYVEFLCFGGVGWFYRESPVMVLLVLSALMGSFMVTYSTAKAEALQLTPPRGLMKRSDRLAVLIMGAGLTPISQMWWESNGSDRAWPLAIAVGIIAVLANVSAINRFRALHRATSP